MRTYKRRQFEVVNRAGLGKWLERRVIAPAGGLRAAALACELDKKTLSPIREGRIKRLSRATVDRLFSGAVQLRGDDTVRLGELIGPLLRPPSGPLWRGRRVAPPQPKSEPMWTNRMLERRRPDVLAAKASRRAPTLPAGMFVEVSKAEAQRLVDAYQLN